MKKFFERDNITLYHGDCMELMASLPDAAFPLAIVDPPYGNAGTDFAGGGRFGQRFDKYKQNQGLTWATKPADSANATTGRPCCTSNSGASLAHQFRRLRSKKNEIAWDTAPGPEYFAELFRVSARQIIWGGNYFDLPPRRGFAIWDKLNPDGVSFASCEYAWISWPVNARIFRGAPTQRHNRHGELYGRFHPTQKPEALYRWLLGLFAAPGEMVLDTHAGSCSLLVACYQTGHPAIGIEIDADYCERAVERLEIEMAQPRLIDLPERREINGELSF